MRGKDSHEGEEEEGEEDIGEGKSREDGVSRRKTEKQETKNSE